MYLERERQPDEHAASAQDGRGSLSPYAGGEVLCPEAVLDLGHLGHQQVRRSLYVDSIASTGEWLLHELADNRRHTTSAKVLRY